MMYFIPHVVKHLNKELFPNKQVQIIHVLIIQYDAVHSQQQTFLLELDKHFKLKGRGRFS